MNEQAIDWKTRYEALVRQLQEDEGLGIYPMGHLSEEQRESFKRCDAYKCGWDDAAIANAVRMAEILKAAEDGLSQNVTMLLNSGYAFTGDGGKLSLNMNDTWGWALAWCPEIPDDQVKEVARLFRAYGNAGLLYWHSQQEGGMRSEFYDNNRQLDFVENEERIRKEVPDHNKRAYHKTEYMVRGERSAI